MRKREREREKEREREGGRESCKTNTVPQNSKLSLSLTSSMYVAILYTTTGAPEWKPDPSCPQLQTPKPQPDHFKVGQQHHHEQGCGGSHGE